MLEFEQLVKIHFADSGTKADVIANLEATRAWVLEQNEENLAAARAYLAGQGPFPQRAALNQLPGRFLTEFYVTVARWVDWASAIVEHVARRRQRRAVRHGRSRGRRRPRRERHDHRLRKGNPPVSARPGLHK